MQSGWYGWLHWSSCATSVVMSSRHIRQLLTMFSTADAMARDSAETMKYRASWDFKRFPGDPEILDDQKPRESP
eukprot:1359588-Amorphochlora_amoeboformis.AAC.3